MTRLPHALCVTAFAIFAAEAFGQAPGTLGLTQAVEAALENHPLMRSARLGIDQAANRAAEARAERIPKVRISETLTRGNNPVFVFGSLLEQGRFGPQNFSLPALNNPESITNLRTVLSASLPVFDGMKTSARIAQGGIGNRQAMRQERFVEQRVRFEVVENYFGVRVAEAALDVAGEAIRMAESDVRRARDRLEAGLAVESDLLAAQVQLAEFRQQQIQAEGNFATALAVLNISMGSPSDTQRALTIQLQKKNFDVRAPDDLVARALRHRQDYLQAESGIEFADRRVAERRSEYLPELNVFASLGSSGHTLATGLSSTNGSQKPNGIASQIRSESRSSELITDIAARNNKSTLPKRRSLRRPKASESFKIDTKRD
jgi:outer membrane protein